MFLASKASRDGVETWSKVRPGRWLGAGEHAEGGTGIHYYIVCVREGFVGPVLVSCFVGWWRVLESCRHLGFDPLLFVVFLTVLFLGVDVLRR